MRQVASFRRMEILTVLVDWDKRTKRLSEREDRMISSHIIIILTVHPHHCPRASLIFPKT